MLRIPFRKTANAFHTYGYASARGEGLWGLGLWTVDGTREVTGLRAVCGPARRRAHAAAEVHVYYQLPP